MPLFNPNYDSSYWHSKEFEMLEPQDLRQLTSFLNTFLYVPTTEEELPFSMDLDDESVEETKNIAKAATPDELLSVFFKPTNFQKTGLQLLLLKFPTSAILTENLDLIYDKIIQPILFANDLSFEDVVTIVNQQFTTDIDEEIASYLLRRICVDMVSSLDLNEKELKQFISLAPTEIFIQYFLETILQKSGLFETLLKELQIIARGKNQFIEEIEEEYYKNFFETTFLPLVGQLTLSGKLQACQQWFDRNSVESRKEYYLSRLLKEILLPSFAKDQGVLSQVSWQKISSAFINAILAETQHESPLLRKEILQAILEKNPETLLGLSLILAEDILPLLLMNKKNSEIFPWNRVSDQFIYATIVFITEQSQIHNDLKAPILQEIFKRKPKFCRQHQEKLLQLPNYIEECFLPLCQLDKKNIDTVEWNAVTNTFIDRILDIIKQTAKYDDLKKEILQKLVEKRIGYFSERQELFLQFQETFLKFSAYFVLKNFSPILSFIKDRSRSNGVDVKLCASIFEPYEQLIGIQWKDISDDTIDVILSYAKDTKNEGLEIAVLKGIYQHNIEYFKRSSDYEYLYELFSSLSGKNKTDVATQIFNWVNMGWYNPEVNLEILNQLLARIDFNTFIKAIPQERLSYYITVFLTSSPDIIAEHLAAVVSRINETTNVEEKKEQLSQLLVLSSSENNSVRTEIARIAGLLKLLTNLPPEFLNGVQEYFQSLIYSFEYNQITLLEFRDTLNNIIEICKSEPDQAYVFLEMLGKSVTHENFFSQIGGNDYYEALAELTNVALADSPTLAQDIVDLKIVKESISYSIIFKEKLNLSQSQKKSESQSSIASNDADQEMIEPHSFPSDSKHIELIKNEFGLKLEEIISSNNSAVRISTFLDFCKQLMGTGVISKSNAQALLKIFHQQFSFLNSKSKQTAKVYSSAFFASETKEIKAVQKKIKESIKEKNQQIEKTLERLGENNEFCRMLAILVNTADNTFGEEKKCSGEPLFQQFYANECFCQCLIGPIQASFNSALKQHKNASPSYLSKNFAGFTGRKSPSHPLSESQVVGENVSYKK